MAHQPGQPLPQGPPAVYPASQGQEGKPATSGRGLTIALRIPSLLQIGFFVVLFIMMCVDLGLKNWLEYGAMDIGLQKVSGGGSSADLSDWEDACDVISSESSYCDNIKRISQAGKVMLAFGIISVLLMVAIIVRLVLLQFFKKTVLRGVLAKVAPTVATGLWILGVVIYIALFAVTAADDSDFKFGGGLGLAIAVAILLAISAVLNFITIKRLLSS